jgi:hypothetical protein
MWTLLDFYPLALLFVFIIRQQIIFAEEIEFSILNGNKIEWIFPSISFISFGALQRCKFNQKKIVNVYVQLDRLMNSLSSLIFLPRKHTQKKNTCMKNAAVWIFAACLCLWTFKRCSRRVREIFFCKIYCENTREIMNVCLTKAIELKYYLESLTMCFKLTLFYFPSFHTHRNVTSSSRQLSSMEREMMILFFIFLFFEKKKQNWISWLFI